LIHDHEEYRIESPNPRQYDEPFGGPIDMLPPPALWPILPVAPAVGSDGTDDAARPGDEIESLPEAGELNELGPNETPAVTRSSLTRPSHRMRKFQD